jgi:hypothetical protein
MEDEPQLSFRQLSQQMSYQCQLVKELFERILILDDSVKAERYCDERGIYKFYFITIAENIHLQFNKFRFVLTTSNCFCSIYELHLFLFKIHTCFVNIRMLEKQSRSHEGFPGI